MALLVTDMFALARMKDPTLVSASWNVTGSPGTALVESDVRIAFIAGTVSKPTWVCTIVSERQVDAPDAHAPAWQLSPVVQALPSSQVVPLAFATGAGHPVAAMHAPTV